MYQKFFFRARFARNQYYAYLFRKILRAPLTLYINVHVHVHAHTHLRTWKRRSTSSAFKLSIILVATLIRFISLLIKTTQVIYSINRVSLFGGMERWNGMVEWNDGMEWNGIVEWPRPPRVFCDDLYLCICTPVFSKSWGKAVAVFKIDEHELI